MKLCLNILLLLSIQLSVQAVNPPDTLTMDCGQEVQITASPKPGYRFIRWSDGETDNPRWVDLSRDTNLTAIFDYECEDPLVPVQTLYNNLILLDRPAFREMGHNPEAEDVNWYHRVGDVDIPQNEDKDDEWVGLGYYIIIDPTVHPISEYYCLVYVTPPEGKHYCYDYLRSQHEISTDIVPIEAPDPNDDQQWYNILGMPVSPDYKGVIIQYGRKRLQL